MAKSKIIKDLANGTASASVALKRAKVLLNALNNDALLQWVNYELIGYPVDVELPGYRVAYGNLYGTYIKGSMASHMKYSNVPLPLGNLSEDKRDALLSLQFREGIEALARMLEESSDGHRLGKQIPADLYGIIAMSNNDPYMAIVSAEVICSNQKLQDIISAIESRLLDVFCFLEKEFGVLDELDIDTSDKSDEELQNILEKISIIIYNDKRIVIGDNNKIRDSVIASEVKNE